MHCLFDSNDARFLLMAIRVEHSRLLSASIATLSTSLVEDVFSLLYAEAGVLANFIIGSEIGAGSRTGAVLFVDGMQHIFNVLKQTQTSCRLLYLTTLEDSCAAANDFFRMSELMEAFLLKLATFLPSLCEHSDLDSSLQQDGNLIVTLFSQDAVMAAERTQVFILRAVAVTTIASDYFSPAWEEDWTRNEVTLSMVGIFNEYLTLTRRYLGNDYLYHKAVVIAAKAMTCFYIRCLVNKADSVTRRRRNRERIGLPGERHPFRSHPRAVRRLGDDIKVMQNCFQERSGGNTTLKRVIANELSILELIHECLDTEDAASLESFIVVIHKRTGADPLVTRFFVSDLWMLMTHKRARAYVQDAVQHLQPDLQMVTSSMKSQSDSSGDEVSFVQIEYMLKVLYEDRVAQGVLPACWVCLPKVDDEGNEAVAKQIRNLTRKVAELQWGKKTAWGAAMREGLSKISVERSHSQP